MNEIFFLKYTCAQHDIWNAIGENGIWSFGLQKLSMQQMFQIIQ